MDARPVVAFNDFTRTNVTSDLEAVRRVLESGWLILGDEVRNFEQEWANRCGVDHAVGVGNGLDAIEIGLRSLGIGAGDEVITTPMTAVATVLAVLRAGATPVLADINPRTGLLDPASVERCIRPSTKALLLVHLYGQMRDMDTWVDLCEKHGIALLEDCAQAHDAAFNDRVAGSWGAFGAYSFYPTKNLGAAGDAGALVTSQATVAELARALRNYGQSNRYEHPYLGLNSRLDEIQAAMLRERLSHLAAWTARRRAIAATYREQVHNPAIALLDEPVSPENHVYHLFVVTTEHRTALLSHLADNGVESLVHYPIPAHMQGPFSDLARDPAGLQHAEAHGRHCLSIPCAPHLSDADVARAVESMNTFKTR